MKNEILTGGRGYGKSAKFYSEMIIKGKYPDSISFIHKNEINALWERGSTMEAVNKLQTLLEPKKQGKTLL